MAQSRTPDSLIKMGHISTQFVTIRSLKSGCFNKQASDILPITISLVYLFVALVVLYLTSSSSSLPNKLYQVIQGGERISKQTSYSGFYQEDTWLSKSFGCKILHQNYTASKKHT